MDVRVPVNNSSLPIDDNENLKQTLFTLASKPDASVQVGDTQTSQPRLSGETFNTNMQPPNRSNPEALRNYNNPCRGLKAANFTRRRPHQVYMDNLKQFEDTFANKYYKRYFIIKSKSGSNIAEFNVIKANNELKAVIKRKPKAVTELRDGSLLVEVSNEQQSTRIQKI